MAEQTNMREFRVPGFSHALPVPLVVIADQRTGTTYLRSLLHNSGPFYNAGEIFQDPDQMKGDQRERFNFHTIRQEKSRAEPSLAIPSKQTQELLFLDVLRGISQDPLCKGTPVIDVKYSSLHTLNHFWHSPVDPPYLFSLLAKYDFPVLHIWRRNTFRQYLSHQLALQSGQYTAVTPAEIRHDAITIDVEHMKASLKMMDANRAKATEWIQESGVRMAPVAYEDFSISYEAFQHTVSEPLKSLTGITLAGPLSTPLQQLVSDPVARINNPEQVKKALHETGMGDFWGEV